MGVGSDRRRSATGGEPIGNWRDENGSQRDGGQRLAAESLGQLGVEHGQEELAVCEVLDDAVVVRRAVVRVQARVGLGRNREEANRHQRADHRQRDEKARGRKAVAVAELQDVCNKPETRRRGKRYVQTPWAVCAQSKAICPLTTRA